MADDAPGGLQHEQDGRAAENEVQFRRRPGIQHDDVIIPDDIPAHCRSCGGQQDIVPVEPVLVARGPRGIEQIDEDEDEAEMDRALDLRRIQARRRRKELKGGKEDAKAADEYPQPAPKRAERGFLVVFGDDLRNVQRVLDLGRRVGIQPALFKGEAAGTFLLDDLHPLFMTHGCLWNGSWTLGSGTASARSEGKGKGIPRRRQISQGQFPHPPTGGQQQHMPGHAPHAHIKSWERPVVSAHDDPPIPGAHALARLRGRGQPRAEILIHCPVQADDPVPDDKMIFHRRQCHGMGITNGKSLSLSHGPRAQYRAVGAKGAQFAARFSGGACRLRHQQQGRAQA